MEEARALSLKLAVICIIGSIALAQFFLAERTGVKNSIKIPPTKGRKASTHSLTHFLGAGEWERRRYFTLLPAHLTTHKRVSVYSRTRERRSIMQNTGFFAHPARRARIFHHCAREVKRAAAQCIKVCVSRRAGAQKVHFKDVSFAPENSKHSRALILRARQYIHVKLKRSHLSTGNFVLEIISLRRDLIYGLVKSGIFVSIRWVCRVTAAGEEIMQCGPIAFSLRIKLFWAKSDTTIFIKWKRKPLRSH
jgi:hypothetical protein